MPNNRPLCPVKTETDLLAEITGQPCYDTTLAGRVDLRQMGFFPGSPNGKSISNRKETGFHLVPKTGRDPVNRPTSYYCLSLVEDRTSI